MDSHPDVRAELALPLIATGLIGLLAALVALLSTGTQLGLTCLAPRVAPATALLVPVRLLCTGSDGAALLLFVRAAAWLPLLGLSVLLVAAALDVRRGRTGVELSAGVVLTALVPAAEVLGLVGSALTLDLVSGAFCAVLAGLGAGQAVATGRAAWVNLSAPTAPGVVATRMQVGDVVEVWRGL